MHDPDPIRFIQSITDQWISRDWEERADGIILGGDFNSRWLPGEHGGQRVLSTWADDRFLINGPRLVADRGHLEFYTFGRPPSASWIDHILHAGSADRLDILGAFNDIGPFVDDISDHKPIMSVYKTSLPANGRIICMPKPPPRPEIPRGDKKQINAFKHAIRDALQQVPNTASTPAEERKC
jgi:hypothetical protein